MCLLAQAEAAALTAFRAGAKGSSATVVASLQAGAADLFEKAAKVVREYTGEGGGRREGVGLQFGDCVSKRRMQHGLSA